MPVKPPTRPVPNAVFIPNLTANLMVPTMPTGGQGITLTVGGIAQVVTYDQATDSMVITDQVDITNVTVPNKARNDLLKAIGDYALAVATTMFEVDAGNQVVRQGKYFVEKPI